MTDTADHSDDVPSLPTDIAALRDRGDVPVSESTRPLPDEKFGALRERYDAIAGVLQMGLTNGAGEVLLWGDDGVAPPGVSVDGGEDWDGAARSALKNLTGQRVEIGEALLLEVTRFARESDESETFPAPSVHSAASLVDPDPEFLADPSPPDGFDHPMFDEPPRLRWFDAVAEEVEANHEHHVELYLG